MSDPAECPYDGIDLLSSEFGDRFEDITQDMLNRCPVPRTAAGWMITRYEDVHSAVNDWRLFSSGAKGINPWRPEDFWFLKPLEADPPLHGKFRKPLQRLFAPGPTAAREPAIRQIARDLLTRARKTGRFEVSRDFARPYVGTAFFTEILGLPAEQAADFTELVHEMLNGPLEGQQQAADEYVKRVDDVLTHEKEHGNGNELLQTILNLEIDGAPAVWEDKRGMLSVLIIGGLDTTVFTIVSALNYLAEHPNERNLIASDPSLVPAAVEEFLRVFAPAWVLGRTAMADAAIGGRRISAGDYVLLSFGLANRDPHKFEDPLAVKLDRPQTHMAFGAGPHRCIGSHLARLEIRVALEEFLGIMPAFERTAEKDPSYTTTMIRGVTSLTVDVL